MVADIFCFKPHSIYIGGAHPYILHKKKIRVRKVSSISNVPQALPSVRTQILPYTLHHTGMPKLPKEDVKK